MNKNTWLFGPEFLCSVASYFAESSAAGSNWRCDLCMLGILGRQENAAEAAYFIEDVYFWPYTAIYGIWSLGITR